MKIGIILGVLIGIIIFGVAVVSVLALNILPVTGTSQSSPTPSVIVELPPVTTTAAPSTKPAAMTTAPSASKPASSAPASTKTAAAAQVNFDPSITSITGDGLKRTITAKISNTGAADAHNVSVKVEVFSGGSRIKVDANDGQGYRDSLTQNFGTIKAGASVTAQSTVSVNVFDGAKIISNGGGTVKLTVTSDEKTQSLSYDFST